MRRYGGSALMLFVTTAAAIGSYTVNLKVSAERAAVDRLRRQIVVDARDMRNLQAELRTRARFPEMQRWNDSVLQMSAPSAQQYLRSPVQLAAFMAPPEAAGAAPVEAPAVRYAVTAPTEAVAPNAPLVRTADIAPSARTAYSPPSTLLAPARTGLARPVAEEATLVRASYPAPAKAYTPPSSMRQPPRRTGAGLAADIGASLDAAPATGVPHDLLPDGGR